MGIKYNAIEIEVRGSSLYGLIEMMRYDNCVPATEVESGKVEQLISNGEAVALRLKMFIPVGVKKEPTRGRWQSFGWDVLSVDARSFH